MRATSRALSQGKPEIVNSDQGSQYTSSQYIKYEEVYLKEYRTPREAREGLREYFEFHNNRRPHQALGYRTPAEVYLERKNEEMIAGS